jgi:hypothetical protein
MDGAYYISKSTECISVKSDVGLWCLKQLGIGLYGFTTDATLHEIKFCYDPTLVSFL